MNLAERGMAEHLGPERLARLQALTVGVAGAGGLGSNCAMHLVRSGFRRFVIADFDVVEPSNLNRQAYRLDQVGLPKVDALAANLRQVNPDAEVEVHRLRLAPENLRDLFAGCDAVVEALDDPAAKAMVAETFWSGEVLLVLASGMGGAGDADALVTRRVREGVWLVGDGETPCDAGHPPLSPRVGVAAAKQADVVLSHFLNRIDNEGGA
ncbi:sulfur carrier protein ThiS adenylyltransferase ThiF [Pseudodesulfovibrio sp.]|uniref:sulfur carrier protein ThiS adenylyltransferase ThiF n=1 Tax=Pseudodesulfovibrio sp. TaxID=2035812 RepID=UPI0026184F7A|nr:sulfur carrier protein ThiS adenylyltransferase ThiF [Pseudodesulfovibrio sp.]MDD3311513.1 sulfur carrier protein ThiS adenylyltransferase ThiF [Pseudodesulfovibrio sp.]